MTSPSIARTLMPMIKHTALAIPFLAAVVLSVGLAASMSCSSDDGGLTGGCPRVVPDSQCTDSFNMADEFSFVTPDLVHTGWNGRDTYRAVLVASFGQFEVGSADNNVVCAARLNCPREGEQDVIALLTTQGPGSTTVTVTSGGQTFAVPVDVTSYTPQDYDLGSTRYLSPADANGTTRQACGNCHLGQGGAPHSPLALARYSDRELVFATQNSKYPGTCEDSEGETCDCVPTGEDCSACSGTCTFNEGTDLSLATFGGGVGDHTFNLTAEEEVGIMAFMRAIDPEGI